MNAWLIDTYAAIRKDWQRVAAILDGMKNTKQEYMRIRSIQPDTLDLFQRAAHLVYLNKTCFRGLLPRQSTQPVQRPYGAYDRRYYDPDNFEGFAAVLKSVKILCCDFELCIAEATSRDFIYFDPPYYKLGGYSDFNRYTRFQFRENDHIRLAAVCRELDRKGIRWAVSNSDTPFVKTLFKGYRMNPDGQPQGDQSAVARARDFRVVHHQRLTLENWTSVAVIAADFGRISGSFFMDSERFKRDSYWLLFAWPPR